MPCPGIRKKGVVILAEEGRSTLSRRDISLAFHEILSDIPDIYRRAEPLRKTFLNIILSHRIAYAENILHPDLWIVYPFYVSLIKHLYPRRDITILDWGGLYGHVTALLKEAGYENTRNYLLNIPSRYDLFRETFKFKTLYGKNPNHLDLPDHSHDIVISSGVLEHVREDGMGDERVILQEIRRILKPGGTFWIWYLPSKYSPSEALNRLTRRWHHTWLPGKREIISLLRQAGFQILFLSRHGFLPGTLKRGISPPLSPALMFKIDTRFATFPGLSFFAANFFIMAMKPGPHSSGESQTPAI